MPFSASLPALPGQTDPVGEVVIQGRIRDVDLARPGRPNGSGRRGGRPELLEQVLCGHVTFLSNQ